MPTYRHSGAAPITGAIITSIAGLMTAALLGIVYTFALAYIPFIFVNLVMTIGFGLGIGWVIGTVAKLGKIRNPALLTSLAVACSIVGIYCEWGITPITLFGADVGLSGFHPQAIANMVTHLYEQGSWGFHENSMVSGWGLVVVWAGEIVTIFWSSVYGARSRATHQPFCEICDEWTDTEQQVQAFLADGTETTWIDFTPTTLQSLLDFPLADATAEGETVVRLNLALCPTCANSNYLTLEKVSFTIDKHGSRQEKSEPIIRNVLLSAEQLEVVRVIAARQYMSDDFDSTAELPSTLPPLAGDASAPSLHVTEV